jgi:predicted transcriptional regulator of viral defense system
MKLLQIAPISGSFCKKLIRGDMFSETISQLASEGRSSFSFEELKLRVHSSPEAIKSALRRSLKKGDIAMPYRGFYVILPPEYRSLGCRPAEQFIPDLMGHLGEVYYAGLLNAAEYHGAAHHRPQVFQVMVAKPRRSIQCGKVNINFIVKNNVNEMPIQSRNTPAGLLNLSTPEVTAFDLVGYYKLCGWLDNVATVLAELAEKLEPQKLVAIAELSPIAWAQRLGYLLELVDAPDYAKPLAKYIQKNKPVRTPLLSSASIKGAKLNGRWRVFVNTEVEAEI